VTLKQVPSDRSLIWTWYGELLATRFALDLFEEHGLVGVAPTAATVRIGGSEVLRPAIYELAITGWGGFPSLRSGVHRQEHCEFCGLSVYSCFVDAETFIDPDQLDGSDFFFVWPAPRFIFVSKRVIDILAREKITGWRAKPLNEVKCDSQLTPGRLADWVSEERLAQISDHVGPSLLEFVE
jgi:hypothetical protein